MEHLRPKEEAIVLRVVVFLDLPDMNSVDDDAIEKALCREFLGPSCLYKVLEQRTKENPLFLRRNLRKSKESPFRCTGILAGQTSLAINGQAVINFDPKAHFGRYTASLFLAIRQRGTYRVLGGKHCEEGDEEKATPLGSVNVPFKFEVDDRDLEGTECLFMALFVTKNLKSRLTHRKLFEILLAKFEKEESAARLAMCDRLTDSIFPSFDQEYVSFIDLTSHLGPAKMQLGMEARKSTSVFRLFMDPLHRKLINCELKHTQHCRLLTSSPIVPDGDSIPFNISLASMLKASEPLHAWSLPRHPLSSTAVVRKSQPQRTEEISQPNSTLTFHYHIPKTAELSESLSAAPNHFTWQESREFLQCPWCKPTVRPSPVCVDPDTRIPTAATLEAICILGQHLQTCHHHFQFDFGYDFDGSLHVLVTRNHDHDYLTGLDMGYIISRNRKRKISELLVTREEGFFYKEVRIRPIFLRFIEAKAVVDYEAFLASRSTTTSSSSTKETTSEENEGVKHGGIRKTGIVKGKKMDRRLKGRNFYGRSNRTEYFNALTGQPLTVDEVGCDDETQFPEFGQLYMRNQIIDEYSDITLQEKDFMKLWHEHLTTCPPYGDRLLPLVCEQFIEKFADSIVNLNLRHNLLLHLVNLWDFGLLLSEEVQAYMEFVDAYALSLAKGS